METTNHATQHNKKKYHKVDKYFFKNKRRIKPIENRTHATYAQVPNGKGRPPPACSLWCPINSEIYHNRIPQIRTRSTNYRVTHDP